MQVQDHDGSDSESAVELCTEDEEFAEWVKEAAGAMTLSAHVSCVAQLA